MLVEEVRNLKSDRHFRPSESVPTLEERPQEMTIESEFGEDFEQAIGINNAIIRGNKIWVLDLMA